VSEKIGPVKWDWFGVIFWTVVLVPLVAMVGLLVYLYVDVLVALFHHRLPRIMEHCDPNPVRCFEAPPM
jgi:hypothetical protein